MANLRANKITSTEVFETTGSVQFDGSGDYLSLASTSDFAFGTGDFTIELWVMMQSLPTTTKMLLDFRSSGTSEARPTIYYRASNSFAYYADGAIRSEFPSISANRWYYIAICRHNSITRTFLDGIEVGSFNDNVDYLSAPLGIGAYLPDTSQYIPEAHISNVRIIKGTALYTKNFTPPTRELTVIPNTVLLACQSTTNTAQEATGKTITVNGNAVANELTPGLLTDVVKSGGTSAITGSVEFGESDYLTLAPSSDFNLGTGDFTIEFWIHPQKRFTSYPTIFEIDATDNANRLLINFRNTSTLGLTSGTTVFATNAGFDLDEWYHIAVVRESGVSRIYKNGISGGDTACTEDFSNSGSSNVFIGWDSTITSTEKYNGFISNLRVVKGTALYTADFIPPTRELKKVPGTVLLCCQDSNDPTTEATGKTITGYGDLQRADGVELIANGSFTSTDDWTAVGSTLSLSSGALRVTKSGTGRAEANQPFTTAAGKIYRVYFDLVTDSTAADIRVEVFNDSDSAVLYALGGNLSVGNRQSFIFTATSSTSRIELAIASGGSASEFAEFDNVSVTLAETRNGASNFTPQVGSDGSVEFAGPTTINTENYFYLPTGNTESRGRGRGLFGGGQSPSTALNTIDYVSISNTGSAIDFGDLTQARQLGLSGGVSSHSRGVFGGGFGNSPITFSNVIDYVTISTTGNSTSFGSLTLPRFNHSSLSNSTRGLFAGGLYNPGGGYTNQNIIDYITIASLGSANDFGDLSVPSNGGGAVSSPTRGVFALGRAPADTNILDYVTIASTGNTQDFGDLTVVTYSAGCCSSSTRGLFAGNNNPTGGNNIDYITIATTGNAVKFGDLTGSGNSFGGTSNSIRGIFAGGYNPAPTIVNTIDYVAIASSGNASDFGDLTQARRTLGACSDSHGGLG